MKRCLVVVDYQNDFVEGSLGFEGAKELDLCIYNKIMEYVKNNDDVFHSKTTHVSNISPMHQTQKRFLHLSSQCKWSPICDG